MKFTSGAPVSSYKINTTSIFAAPAILTPDAMVKQLPAKTVERMHHIFSLKFNCRISGKFLQIIRHWFSIIDLNLAEFFCIGWFGSKFCREDFWNFFAKNFFRSIANFCIFWILMKNSQYHQTCWPGPPYFQGYLIQSIGSSSTFSSQIQPCVNKFIVNKFVKNDH